MRALLALLGACLIVSASAGCAILGTCRSPPAQFSRKSVNCANAPNTDAIVPSFNLSDCPEYQSRACCDQTQHSLLSSSLGQARQLFGRCPACTENFRRFWCAFACSPDQSDFVAVTETAFFADTIPPFDVAVADTASFSVDPGFASAWLESCSAVQFGSTGSAVLAMLGLQDASPRAFVRFQGLAAPEGAAPFPIAISFAGNSSNGTAFDAPTAACSDAASGFGCGPADCEALRLQASCPLSPEAARAAGGVAASDAQITTAALLAALVVAAGIVMAAIRCLVPPVPEGAPAAGAIRETSAYIPVSDPAAAAMALMNDQEPPELTARRLTRSAALSAVSEEADGEEERVLAPLPPSSRLWMRWGRGVARRPRAVLLAAAAMGVGCIVLAALRLRVETRPARLWVPPRSRGAAEAARHSAAFGPPLRVTQAIATPAAGGRALTQPSLLALLALQKRVAAAVGEWNGQAVRLEDICFSISNACVMESATGYFQDEARLILQPPSPSPDGADGTLESWLRGDGEEWAGCLAAPYSPRCLSAAGMPMLPHVVLGGYGDAEPWDARSLVATWLLRGAAEGSADAAKAAAWERAALAVLAKAGKEAGAPLALAYSAERSLNDEIRKETGSDAPSIALAGLAMFAYVAFTLASPGSTISARLALAAGGMACVCASLAAAAAAAALLRAPVSLISAEVTPFLVLACGVDNMYVLVRAWVEAGRRPAELRAGAALGNAGPAITAAAVAEVVTLVIGGLLAEMPAVRSFCLLSAFAIAADYLLQLTVFVALLALQVAPPAAAPPHEHPPLICPLDEAEASSLTEPMIVSQAEAAEMEALAEGEVEASDDPMRRPPSLLSRAMLGGMGAGWMLLCAALATGAALVALPTMLGLGLEQTQALPEGSYLRPYFDAVASQLEVGPPVEWTLGAPARHPADGFGPPPVPFWDVGLQDRLLALPCAANGSAPADCPPSLLAQLGACGRGEAAAACHLRGSPDDWLGDFLRWADPSAGLCLTTEAGAGGDPSAVPPPCSPRGSDGDLPPIDCLPCPAAYLGTSDGVVEGASPPRPTRDSFLALLPRFLASGCSAKTGVSLCGAPYRRALPAAYVSASLAAVEQAAASGAGAPPPPPPAAASWAGFFAPLRSQAAFIGAHGVSRALSVALSADAAPYRVTATSPFLIYFEQYASLRSRGAWSLMAACLAVLIACRAGLGLTGAATAVALAVGAAVAQAAALSALLLGVQLNALSLANLCAAAGLATEFTVHIAARACQAHRRGLPARAAAAVGLDGAGALVARGVLATKLIGVACLAFSATPIFRKYYFAMYGITLLTCAASALFLLPVLLASLLPEHGAAATAEAAAAIAAPPASLTIRRVWITVRKAAWTATGRGAAEARRQVAEEEAMERETFASTMAAATGAADEE